MVRKAFSISTMDAAVAANFILDIALSTVMAISQMQPHIELSHRLMQLPKLLLVEKLSGLSANQLLLFVLPRTFLMRIMKNLTLTVMGMFCPL
jgi:hypothetical protein